VCVVQIDALRLAGSTWAKGRVVIRVHVREMAPSFRRSSTSSVFPDQAFMQSWPSFVNHQVQGFRLLLPARE